MDKEIDSKKYAANNTPFDENATVEHARSEVEDKVFVKNLHVLISQDNSGTWFAQGLELDYAAEGSSAEDAALRFQEGLFWTLDEHLKRFDGVERLLVPAAAEHWFPYLNADANCVRGLFTKKSIHPRLNFAVEYLTLQKAA